MSTQTTRMSDSMEFNNMLPILVALILVVFTYVLLKQLFGKAKGNTIILVGVEGSGKTALYAQLVAGKEVQTQASVTENTSQLKNPPFKIVDVPGNARLRGDIFAKYSKNVRGVVVVVDSADFVDHVRESSEVLYEVLLNSDVQSSKCPVLLFCNKQDEEMSRGPDPIRSAMERELTTLNNTAVNALSDDSGSQKMLGPANETIKLEKLPNKVTSVGGVSIGTDTDISNLNLWISTL